MSDTTSTENTSPLEEIPWRQVASVAGLVLLIAIVLPFVVYAVPQVVGADHSYVVLSGSMEPTISAGDVIIVNSVAASQIEEGDVITYGEAPPTTHRVIEVTEQDGAPAFRTQGDANEDLDPSLVTADEVQGKLMTIGGYLLVLPYLGYVIQFVNTSAGFTLLFVIPFVLLVVLELKDIVLSSGEGGDTGDSSDANPGADAGDGREPVDDVGVPAGAGAATEEPAEEADSASEGLTFGAHELQLGIGILVVFAAYSVWVSYVTTEIWAFAVTGSVITAFLLFTGLYLFGGSVPEDDTPPAAGGGGEPATRDQGTDSHPADVGEFDPDAVDPGPVEFARGLGDPPSTDGPAASGEAERGESDD